ncbi:unnamed protein product [Brachionus calyciflorus]|uniref:Uncharacterized protein n=1 Tax=Brachionus calyciflorus TaxID=104777 RepID=A0A813SYG3_9BILA|nr:unnamed protein product [Brachionus calyciflorus]
MFITGYLKNFFHKKDSDGDGSSDPHDSTLSSENLDQPSTSTLGRKNSKKKLKKSKNFTSTLEISPKIDITPLVNKQEAISKSPTPEFKQEIPTPIKISEDESETNKNITPSKSDDPFLRDLTACIQLKQQKKLIDLKPADELCNNLEIKKTNTVQKTFAKPNFNLNTPEPSKIKTSTQFNLNIKTPVSAKKCFLNITIDKNESDSTEVEKKVPNEVEKDEKILSFKPIQPTNFKIVKKESDTAVKTKLGHLTPLNQVSSLSQVSTSTSPMVSKAAPVTSFTIASLTPLKPTKLYTNSGTNTENIIVQSIGTNTELNERVELKIPNDRISDSATEFRLKKDVLLIQKINVSTQTSFINSKIIKENKSQNLLVSKKYFCVDKFLNFVMENEYCREDMEFLRVNLSDLVVWANSPAKQLDKCLILIKNFKFFFNDKINYLMLNNAKFKKVSKLIFFLLIY